MADMQLPTADVYPLPTEVLRRPAAPDGRTDESREEQAADMNALCEALTPLISATIARQARQRRYTP